MEDKKLNYYVNDFWSPLKASEDSMQTNFKNIFFRHKEKKFWRDANCGGNYSVLSTNFKLIIFNSLATAEKMVRRGICNGPF